MANDDELKVDPQAAQGPTLELGDGVEVVNKDGGGAVVRNTDTGAEVELGSLVDILGGDVNLNGNALTDSTGDIQLGSTVDANTNDLTNVGALDTDDGRITTQSSSIEFLREYADNPDAAGTKSDPLNNALANLLSQKSPPLRIVAGGDYYKESSQSTITEPGLSIQGAYGERIDGSNRLGTIAVDSGNSLLKVDGSGTNNGRYVEIENLWLYQEANDQTGTGLELLDCSNILLKNVGCWGFDRNLLFDGAVGAWGYKVESRSANVCLETAETNRGATTINIFGGYIGDTQGTEAAILHGSNDMGVTGVTFQGCNREAIKYANADRMNIDNCWFERNATDGSDTYHINVTSTNANRDSRLTITNPMFNSGGNVTDNILLDDDLQLTLINARNPAGRNAITDTANASNASGVVVIGRETEVNLSNAGLVHVRGLLGRIEIGNGGARLEYDSANGEILAIDDAGNQTTIS
jgi:hypothetical protein